MPAAPEGVLLGAILTPSSETTPHLPDNPHPDFEPNAPITAPSTLDSTPSASVESSPFDTPSSVPPSSRTAATSPAESSDQQEHTPQTSSTMARWISHLRPETLVLVQANVRRPVCDLKSVTIKDVELDVLRVGSSSI